MKALMMLAVLLAGCATVCLAVTAFIFTPLLWLGTDPVMMDALARGHRPAATGSPGAVR